MTAWSRPQRSPEATAVYAPAEADRHAHCERYLIEADNVVARATRNGRVSASGFAEGWSQGLHHYLASASEDGRLNAVGARMVVEAAATRLTAGARVASYLAEHPERASASLTPRS